MAVEETNHSRSSSPTEEEYTDRIMRLQMEYLIPLKEDLSDVDDITAENFMTKLDNGVIVCKLAKLIQERCEATQQAFNGKLSAALEEVRKLYALFNSLMKSWPEGEEIPINGVNYKSSIRYSTLPKMKCWENAKSQSFYARDNVCNFLKWCRKFGVRDAVIFESEDLVSHVNPRNVVLCLLEVARIACTKHSFSPAPGLVQFEQEIDEMENVSETDGWSVSSSLQDIESPVCYRDDNTAAGVGRIPSVSSLVSNTSSSGANSTNASTPTKVTSELDHKVMMIAKSYYGREAHQGIQRLSEGGWTTLSHFLERHGGDPTQEISAADLLPLDTRATSVSPRRRTSSSTTLVNNAQTSTTPTFGRYVSSTPVSRRSSLSSPEPWMSASSGYSSSSIGCNGSPPNKITVTPRRRRSSTEAPCRRRALIHRASIGGLVAHQVETSYTAPPSPTRPTSEPIKARYHNYLQSSQHITNRTNAILPLIPTQPIILAKQSVFRKPVQKTC